MIVSCVVPHLSGLGASVMAVRPKPICGGPSARRKVAVLLGVAGLVPFVPSFAVGQTLTPVDTLELTGSDDATNSDLARYELLIDDGLILYDTVPSDDVLLQVYDWVDGELQGPYGLIGETQNGYAIGGAARDGDRLVVARALSVESFLWSDVDQAFVFEATVELPTTTPGNPRSPALHGDVLAVGFSTNLWMYEWDGSAWVYQFEDHVALPMYGHRNMWLEPPYVRLASYYDTSTADPDARVYGYDGGSAWSELSSMPYEGWGVGPGDRVSFSPGGTHAILEWFWCEVRLFEPDGEGTRALGGLEPTTDWSCDDVTLLGTERWAAGTTLNRHDARVSLVDRLSPEPYVWASIRGSGPGPMIRAYGFLDDTHLVTFDKETFLQPNDIGHVVVWELSGPPVLQHLTDVVLDEGASVDLDPAVYVMDPDHDLVDVTLSLAVPPSHGSLALDGMDLGPSDVVDGQAWMDGRVSYAHDGSETVADAVELLGCDPEGACAEPLVVDVVVLPVNDAPLPTDDTLTVAEGGEGLVDVLANDTDADSALDLLGVSVDAVPVGSAAVQTDGLRYTHDGSEPGLDPVLLDITVCDPEGACSPSLVAITVTPVNDPPVASDDAATVDEGGLISVDVLANDVDPDDALATEGTLTVVSGPVHGTAMAVGGALKVQHDGAEATTDVLVYEVCDAAGACARATLQLAVTPVNDPPLLVDDALVLDEGGTATLLPLGNDADVDGTIDGTSLEVVTSPAHGVVTVVGEVLTYAHDGSDTTADGFTYAACDDGRACGEATVEVVVIPVEHAPVAAPDAYGVEGELVVDAADGVLANDTDADSALTAQLVSGPASGTLALAADGGFTYVPNDGFTGTDGFVYAATDGTTAAQAEVVLAVAGTTADLTATGGAVDGGGGCGCTSGGMAGWVAWVPLGLVFRRRVRR